MLGEIKLFNTTIDAIYFTDKEESKLSKDLAIVFSSFNIWFTAYVMKRRLEGYYLDDKIE